MLINTFTPAKTNIALGFFAFIFVAFFSCKNDQKVGEVAREKQEDPELQTLNTAIEKEPNNDSLFYLRARTYHHLKGYDEAIADATKAIQLDSLHPEYFKFLSDVLLEYARPNDSKRALEIMVKAAAKHPQHLPTLLELSKVQLIVQLHSEALSTIGKILEKDPQNAAAFYMTARVALDKKDTTRAVVSARKAVQYDAELSEAWMFLGRIYSERNNPLALQCFDNVIRLDSNAYQARELKGVFYKRRGDHEKAFSEYRALTAQNPDYANAYFDMGMMYLEMDSLRNAYDQFDIAIKNDALFVKAYYYRGLCSEEMGNKEAALNDYKQAYAMLPAFKDAKEAKERLEKK